MKMRKDLPYPENLIIELELDVSNITADQIAGLEYALSTLSGRERHCLLCRYRDGETFEDTAKHYGVTRERIRQVICKALRKLRHPTRMKYILYGMDGYTAMLEEKKAEEARLRKSMDGLRSMTIAELDLSCRSYNCLMRAGYKTLGEVADLSHDELCMVRNLGKKSVEEVDHKIKELMADVYAERPTRGDKIREMTDEQLADVILKCDMTEIGYCQSRPECDEEASDLPCKACVLQWLGEVDGREKE